MPVSFTSIAVGSLWTRPDLADLWGYKGYQAFAKGVFTPANDNKIILFVTEEKQASATEYKDVLKDDLLEWEGPNDHFAEERMLHAKSRGDEIHLFHRPRHHEPFEYRGEVNIREQTLKSSVPSAFTFEILDASRKAWTHDQLLAAFFMYMQLKPEELQTATPTMERFAKAVKKPKQAIAAKLRALAQLDPVLASHAKRASDNVTPLDQAVWDEFKNNWTQTTLMAGESFEAIAGSYWDATESSQIATGDATLIFKEGQTRGAIVEVRRNQYVFRKAVLNSYASTCCVSGLKDERLLIASHIVPWSQDQKNRLNPQNGLCLSALHDRAYDQGLITVLPNRTVRVHPDLKSQKGDAFLSDALLKYDKQGILLPGRFRPDERFLRDHATRFGYM